MAAAPFSSVDHPIVDKIRACSNFPDRALDFFLTLLAPVPSNRVAASQALQLDYVYTTGVHIKRKNAERLREKYAGVPAAEDHAQAAAEDCMQVLQPGAPAESPDSEQRVEPVTADDAASLASSCDTQQPDDAAALAHSGSAQHQLAKPISFGGDDLVADLAGKPADASHSDQADQHVQSARIAAVTCSRLSPKSCQHCTQLKQLAACGRTKLTSMLPGIANVAQPSDGSQFSPMTIHSSSTDNVAQPCDSSHLSPVTTHSSSAGDIAEHRCQPMSLSLQAPSTSMASRTCRDLASKDEGLPISPSDTRPVVAAATDHEDSQGQGFSRGPSNIRPVVAAATDCGHRPLPHDSSARMDSTPAPSCSVR